MGLDAKGYQYAQVVNWMNNADSGKILLPAQVDIDLTNICNQSCFYCCSAEFRKTKLPNIPYTDYITLIEKIASWRDHSPNSYGTTNTVAYAGGGEPTVLPGYEKVIERTIDLGFYSNITTNGSKLHKLLTLPQSTVQKLSWVGIDIDAGTPKLYEDIRSSLTKTSIFDNMAKNAKALTDIGVRVDFKILLNMLNNNERAIRDMFAFVKSVGGRLIYFRPIVMNGKLYKISEKTQGVISGLSEEFGIPSKINVSKEEPRRYSKCHNVLHFPVFCADGKIYLCCDHKGNPNFAMCDWNTSDFRDVWMTKHHFDMRNGIDVSKCPPCRPNEANNQIQDIIDNPALLETLFL